MNTDIAIELSLVLVQCRRCQVLPTGSALDTLLVERFPGQMQFMKMHRQSKDECADTYSPSDQSFVLLFSPFSLFTKENLSYMYNRIKTNKEYLQVFKKIWNFFRQKHQFNCEAFSCGLDRKNSATPLSFGLTNFCFSTSRMYITTFLSTYVEL